MKEKRAPHDPALPGLAELVSVEGLPGALADAAASIGLSGQFERAQLEYVRYRPGLRCTLLWSLTGSQALFSATLLSKEGEARWADHAGFKQLARGPTSARSTYLSSQRLLMQAFPEDIGLPGLGSATSDGWALGLLATSDARIRITPWRYRPQLACVLEYALERAGSRSRYFAKVYGDERHRTVWSALEQLRGSEPGWRFAPPVAYDAEAGVVVSEAIEGRSVAETLEAASADAEARAGLLGQIGHIAGLLPALQARSIDGLPTLSAREKLTALRKRVRRVTVVAAHEGELLAALCDELQERHAEMEDEPIATAHGAFRDGQVLLTDNEPVVLDLDGLCRAGANVDAGTFLASLDRIAVCQPRLTAVAEACVAAFADAVRRQPSYSPEWLAWHRAAGIAKKALHSISSLDARWPERIEALAERARATLGATPARSKLGG
ncbi:MAG: hypothetical protein WD939_08085 [Dehalococcoidia bacterium]